MRPAVVLIRNHLFGLRTAIRHMSDEPALKQLVIGSFSVGWLVCLSWLFYSGFEFLYQLGGAAFFLVPRLFTLFFLGLGAMLMLSGAVTGYAQLFQVPELKRLLCWPVPLHDLFYYSFIKAALMSSWAFFFIIVPFIGAFGVYRGWSLWMIAWSVAFSLPFVMLFAGLGILLMMLLVRWMPRGRTLGLLILLILTTGLWWVMGYIQEMRMSQQDDVMALARFVPGLELASHPLLPSGWMARGILALARGEWSRGLLYLTLLSTSVPVLYLGMAKLGEWVYPESFQKQMRGRRDIATKASWISQVIHQVHPGQGAIRAFGVKDSLIFMRDPTQWTQFFIFFGLLALYFVNLGSLGYNKLEVVWANLISFLNLFSLSAVMSSLSSRFVYPQISLEARCLWLVGLAPDTLRRLIWVKFSIAFGALLFVSLTLSSLSMLMLDLPAFSVQLGWVLMPCVSLALSGMSTGLGGQFMDTHPDRTPAQILSGYGGTLNLVLTLMTVIVLVLPPGIVAHLKITEQLNGVLDTYAFPLTALYILILSMLAGGIPMLLGARSLRNRDF